MRQKPERWAAYAGVLAVVLWIVGIIVQESGNIPADGASDAEYLAHIQDDTNSILTGGWIFMIGCLAFLVFAVVLRDRLAAAEGGSRLFANIAFVGAVAVGVFGLLVSGPEIAAAISSDDISASTAAALSHLGDAFFVAAELSAILLMLGAGTIALRTALLPKWCALVRLPARHRARDRADRLGGADLRPALVGARDDVLPRPPRGAGIAAGRARVELARL